MLMTLRIALLSLWQHRRRTVALGASIAFVTALLLVMLGVSEGMNRALIESSTTLMSGHVNVAGFFKVTAGQAAPVVTHARDIEAVVRREVPELTYLASRGRGYAKLISEQGSQMLSLTGVVIGDEQGLKQVLRLKAGRLEDLAKPNSLVIFEDQAAQLEVRVGDALTISAPTPRGTSNTVDVTVVAIARSLGLLSSLTTFINAQTLRRLYQLNDDTTGVLQVYLPSADLEQAKQVQARLKEALAKAGYAVMEEDPRAYFFKFENVSREPWTGQRLDLTTWHDEVSFVAWTVDLMSAVSFFLATVLMAIIGVGIMIVMWMSVRERTREIGTLRAIGMQRTGVLALFLTEGFLLGALSTVAGTALGLLTSALLNAAHLTLPVGMQLVLMADRLTVVPTLQWTLVSPLFITAVVTLVSLLPSTLAARLQPVTAMAHGG